MEKVYITEVEIDPIPSKDGLIGFTNFVVNSGIKICNVGIHSCPSSPQGIRLVFPQKKYKTISMDTVYPIKRPFYEAMATAVAKAYRELMEKLN